MNKFYSFASALYSLAEKKQLIKEVYTDLGNLIMIFKKYPNVIKLFSNQALTKKNKLDLMNVLFKPYINQLTFDFIRVIIDMHQFLYVKKIFIRYFKLVEEHDNSCFIKIISAYDLDIQHINKIKNILEKKLKKNLIIYTHVDKNLIAGAKIEFNRLSLDWTIQGRLKEIERSLRSNLLRK